MREGRTFLALATTTLGMALLPGCSGGGADTPTPRPPVIASQTGSRTVSPGTDLVFEVDAQGDLPLSYQWTWNGHPIPGATLSSYRMGPAVSSDDGSVYAVTVRNPAGTLASAPMALAVEGAPRAPLAGDLRFKDVDAFPRIFTWADWGEIIVSGVIMSQDWHQSYGTALCLQDYDLSQPHSNAWSFATFGLPEGFAKREYVGTGGNLADLDGHLAGLDGKVVVTSLDIDRQTSVYGVTYASTEAPLAFPVQRGVVDASLLQDVATEAGGQGRVLTAVSWLDGQAVYYLAYGLDAESGVVYETKVASANLDTLETVARRLSDAGYLITAAGGNRADGYLLVGTRRKGDATPRPVAVVSSLPWALPRGFASVLCVEHPGGYLCVGQQ